jgi:hypothetical protein
VDLSLLPGVGEVFGAVADNAASVQRENVMARGSWSFGMPAQRARERRRRDRENLELVGGGKDVGERYGAGSRALLS